MEKLNIKITEASRAKIEAALYAVNDKAVKRAGVIRASLDAESRLTDLKLPKDQRPGAVWTKTSGAPVANSYDNKRTGTRITLERAKTGWVLTGVERVELHKEGGGAGKLALTRAQYDEAAKRLMAGVSIIGSGAGE